MIGRFARLGVYRELFRSRDFYVILAAGLLAALSYGIDRGGPAPSRLGMAAALTAVAINGIPIIWGAVKGVLRREVNVDELVSIAIVASLIQGEFLTAAVVSFVMTLGSLIEEATSESARKAIHSLIRISARTATVISEGNHRVVPVEHPKS